MDNKERLKDRVKERLGVTYTYICPQCKSDIILFNATARWDKHLGAFEIIDILNLSAECLNCGSKDVFPKSVSEEEWVQINKSQ